MTALQVLLTVISLSVLLCVLTIHGKLINIVIDKLTSSYNLLDYFLTTCRSSDFRASLIFDDSC